MADRPEDNELLFRGPTIDADGHVSRPSVPAGEQQFAPPPPEPEPGLARSTIPPMQEQPPEPAPQPKRSRAVLIIGVALGLGVTVLATALLFTPKVPLPDGVRDSNVFRAMTAAKGQVMISSEPPGAKVFIGDTLVGVTPWAADNRYVGTVQVRVEAQGFAPRSATFEGGKDQTVELDLRKREGRAR